MTFPVRRFVRPGLLASAAVAALLSMTSHSALAQGRPDNDGWSVRLGALGIVSPDYEGSDDYKVLPVPDVEITYGKHFFFGRDGLGANLIANDDLRLGVAVGFDGGRKSSKNDALTGFMNVDDTAVGRAFVEYSLGQFMLNADVTMDVLGDGHDGTIVTAGINYMTNAGSTMLIVGPSVSWASGNYMHSYFSTDVSRLRPTLPTELVRPGSPVGYKASSGIKDVGLTAIAIHPLNDHWAITGIAGYTRLMGDAADSPFVSVNGSRDQFFGGLGLSYSF